MKLTADQFKRERNKRLTLLGMSGVGKTHLSKLLSSEGSWFHFSGDFRIGTSHLHKEIIDNISYKMKQDPWLFGLLKNNSISVNSQVTFDNLEPISAFLGKVGNPEEGGLPITEFVRRQALFLEAEIKAMHDVPHFIESSHKAGYQHFINDAGGSLCELESKALYETLSKNTLILYIKASESTEKALVDRAGKSPKPIYYHPDFFQSSLDSYLKEKKLSYVAQISPDEFVRWAFPRLIENRQTKYQDLADQYGYTINSDDLYSCKVGGEVVNLICEALD